ncbi:DEAD/DEAH box helicase [Pontiellaceae bacterium B12219]|nr:DEAD/DEAH box helicase [Pontiellaceae bacterium B12219]
MKLDTQDRDTIKHLLQVEHTATANLLGFSDQTPPVINEKVLYRSIGLIDKLSRHTSQHAKKIVIILSSILWTYRDENWDGLKEFLVVSLTRAGFSPSSIMIDTEYNHDKKQYSLSGSILNQFSVALHQLEHEIFISEQSYLLTGFQKRTWDKMLQVKLLGISAPTSAGKSFLILLKGIDMLLQHGGSIIYIVPTLSLVSQVALDFHQKLKEFGLDQYRVATTYSDQDNTENRIYILTQEKAISAFSQNDRPFTNVRLLVVDEIQNIERVANEGDQRAKTLYDTLIEFRYACEPDLTILSGPRIEGLKALGVEIFEEESADEEKSKDSPVASFTYSISKSGKHYYLNQYSDITETPSAIKIDNPDVKGYGKSMYKEDFFEYLSGFISNLGRQSRNIIFSPTSDQARKTAVNLAENSDISCEDPVVKSLVEYIRMTVHPDYDLCKTIPKRFAYHHGKMPMHVRSVVERAIRDKLIDNVTCTTTLMQGVNLPAQNVIVRNPDLAIRSRDGCKPKLTDYEIANLRGRAGRLLKDFIGRTYVLEENAFEREEETMELFPEAEKELHSGYGDTYQKHKEKIDKCLEANTAPNEDTKEYSFLMTYIRQVVLKHRTNAWTRLKAVGINLDGKQIHNIENSLSMLKVPHEICYKNRYWDPIDLNRMWLEKELFSIPSNPNAQNIAGKLESLMGQMYRSYSTYYERHLKIRKNQFWPAAIAASNWMKEKTLQSMLQDNYFDTPEKIDKQIALIQNDISYGLTMLLKPIYDMKAPDHMFLRFIEIGAYRPITRKMIELNVPRETAISLTDQFFNGINIDTNEDIEDMILQRLRRVSDEISYWEKVQIEGLL